MSRTTLQQCFNNVTLTVQVIWFILRCSDALISFFIRLLIGFDICDESFILRKQSLSKFIFKVTHFCQ